MNKDLSKKYTKHKGVRIYKVKELVPGSDLDFTLDGRIKKTKACYEYSYVYGMRIQSYPYDTLEECKASIDNIERQVKEGTHDFDPVEFANTMNE